MRLASLLITAAVLAGMLLHAGPQQALACSCFELPTDEAGVRERLEYYDAVIRGRPTSIDKEGAIRTVRFRVSEVYKGHVGRNVTFRLDFGGSAACEYEFYDTGGEHFVSMRQRDGRYMPELCTSFQIPEGSAPPPFLATVTRIAPPHAPSGGGGFPTVWYAIAAGAAGLAVTGWLASRRILRR